MISLPCATFALFQNRLCPSAPARVDQFFIDFMLAGLVGLTTLRSRLNRKPLRRWTSNLPATVVQPRTPSGPCACPGEHSRCPLVRALAFDPERDKKDRKIRFLCAYSRLFDRLTPSYRFSRYATRRKAVWMNTCLFIAFLTCAITRFTTTT